MSKALFANQRETNLASTVAVVEEVLAGRGGAHRVEGTATALHAWQLSTHARLLLLHRSEFTHIRVQAVVMTLDARVDRAALYAELLEHNAGLCGAAFATAGDRVLLVSERSTLDLDRSEVTELITRVLDTASHHTPVLITRYGGVAGGVAT
jgi:hypothetical protein